MLTCWYYQLWKGELVGPKLPFDWRVALLARH